MANTAPSVCCMDNSQPFPAAVAKTVREAMDTAGESINSLSAKTGIPRSTLTRLLTSQNTTRTLEVGHLALIADALNLAVFDLLPAEAVA